MGENSQKPKKNWVLYLILGGFIVKIARFLFKKENREDIKDNISDFVKAEKKEIKELEKGRESFMEYCRDSGNIFKDYFIPNDCNGHKPKILRTRSLALILVAALILKAAITGYLFFIYPNEAKMEETIIKEIMELTNNDRAINNIGQLKLDPALSAAAFAKADDMLKNGYFSHYSPDGKKPWDWISRASYPYLFVGENLAMDFSSAQSAHDALMKSPSHRKNILNGTYKDVGFAVVTGDFNGRKTNILVELFAERRESNLAVNTEQKIIETAVKSTDTSTGTKVLAAETTKTETPKPATKTPTPAKPVVKAETVRPAPAATSTAKNNNQPQISTSTPASTSPAVASVSKPEPLPSELMRYGAVARTSEVDEVSPNQELIDKPTNKIFYITSTDNSQAGLANRLIAASRYILFGLAILLVIALMVNIFIEITVQHKPVIIQTLLLILLISGLAVMNFHILEDIAQKVALI